MADIFVSYARRDKARVAPIVDRLRAAGFRLWWDDDIAPDAPWETTIERALDSAAAVIVCWSNEAVASENVRSEARWAKSKGKLVQLYLDPCDPPLFFGERQGIDLAGWRGDIGDPRFARLMAALDAAAGRDRAEPPPGDARPRRWNRPAPLIAGAIALVLIAAGAVWLMRNHTLGGTRVRIDRLQVAAGDSPALLLRQSLVTDLSRATIGNDATLDFQADSGDTSGAGKADYAVTGEAQSAGGTLHAAVRLVDGGNGTILWSREFSDDAGNPGTLRLLMAQRVADVLICAFGSRSRRPADIDIATLKLFLAGCENYHADWRAARDYFADVVARRPDFAQARGMYAATLFWSTGSFSGVPRSEWPRYRDLAYSEAKAALARDERIGAAYFALAHQFVGLADSDKKLDLLRRGERLDPDSGEVALQLCDSLTNLGMTQAGLAACERADTLDPFSRLNAANLAETYGFAGRRLDAERVLAEARSNWPGEFYTSWIRFDVAARKGDAAAALAMLDNPTANPGYHPQNDAVWRRFLQARADPAKVAETAVWLAAAAPSLNQQGQVEAEIDLVQLGRIDDAIRLALSLPAWSNAWTGRLFYDVMAPLRQDPRFRQIAQRQGLTAAWRKLDGLPDFCGDPDLKWRCPASPGGWTQ